MPMALALGLCMLAVATTTIIMAQEDRDNAVLRQKNAATLLVSDSAIAEVLTALSRTENAVLLGKTYDPINPNTGAPYLGNDGIPNSGDENFSLSADQWTPLPTYTCQSALGLPPRDLSFLVNRFNAESGYRVLAYRYIAETKTGHLLVEGMHHNKPSTVHVSLAIAHDSRGFPGVLADSVVYWQGRNLTGQNSNVYFNPQDDDYPERLRNLALDFYASPNDGTRERYLNMLWSGVSDGFATSQIEGDLIACPVTLNLPVTPQGEHLESITKNLELKGIPGGKNVQVPGIDLQGTQEIQVDTTNGPVQIYVQGTTRLSGRAKIRNYRQDGQLPQVGDLRIIQTLTESAPVLLEDTACIENALIYSPEVDVHLFTTGNGCPGSSESNIVGVVWAEDIENSTISSNDFDNGDDGPSSSDVSQSGVEVPEDVSSLIKDVEILNLPVLYRISSITAWNSVNL